jgi:hypothetical protein
MGRLTPTAARYKAELEAGRAVHPNPPHWVWQKHRAEAIESAARAIHEETGRKCVYTPGIRGGIWTGTWTLEGIEVEDAVRAMKLDEAMGLLSEILGDRDFDAVYETLQNCDTNL